MKNIEIMSFVPDESHREDLEKLVSVLTSRQDLAIDIEGLRTLTLVGCFYRGGLIAIVSISLIRRLTGLSARIMDLVVLPRFRRKNIATLVLRFALGIAFKSGAEYADICPRSYRKEAISLYQNLGFVETDLKTFRFKSTASS